MTETDPSGGQVSGDGTVNPNPSQTADSQPSIDAAEIFNALQAYPAFKAFVASQAQSKHDKRIHKIETKLGLAEQIAEVDALEAQGLPRELAVQWYEMRNSQVQAQPETVDPSVVQGSPAGQQANPGQDDVVSQVAKDLGLDPNGPEVTEILRTGGTQVEQISKLTSKFAEKAGVVANPAATMTTSTGQPVQAANLEAQFAAERDALGMGHPMEFQALKDKYRKLGLDIL